MRHLITPACLIAALAAYMQGSATGIGIFVAIGMLMEGIFWLRLLRPAQKTEPSTRQESAS